MTKLENDVAISVKSVSKNFALPHEKVNSVKSSVVQVFRKKDRTVEVQHALKDISFDIKKGEFFGILGRNGSGKSTLLKILAEIYQPTKGSIETTGKLVPFIELGVGFNPELTGRENVYLNGALLGFSRKEIDARYDEIVEFAELEDFMDQKLKNYSSGMQVRLAFSVATRAEADILLVDEVLAVGDADFQRKCFTFFKALKRKHTTVVFVTHDMSAVREYCDKAVLIEEGKVIKIGDAAEVANQYLKLFNKSSNPNIDSDDNRWGTQTARIEHVEVRIENNKNVCINADIKNYNDSGEFVIGFRIKDSEGRVVAGFNSEDVLVRINQGELKSVRFTLPTIFGNDIFVVDTTLRKKDDNTICDNWDGAGSFSMMRNISSSYSIIPEVKIEIK